jgi:hypothetical protein
MSIEEIRAAVFNLQSKDPSVDTTGACIETTEKVIKAGNEVKQTPPFARMIILKWPPEETNTEEGFHYTPSAQTHNATVIFSLACDNGFPKYIGPIEEAPGLFLKMKAVDKIS